MPEEVSGRTPTALRIRGVGSLRGRVVRAFVPGRVVAVGELVAVVEADDAREQSPVSRQPGPAAASSDGGDDEQDAGREDGEDAQLLGRRHVELQDRRYREGDRVEVEGQRPRALRQRVRPGPAAGLGDVERAPRVACVRGAEVQDNRDDVDVHEERGYDAPVCGQAEPTDGPEDAGVEEEDGESREEEGDGVQHVLSHTQLRLGATLALEVCRVMVARLTFQYVGVNTDSGTSHMCLDTQLRCSLMAITPKANTCVRVSAVAAPGSGMTD